MALEKLNSSDVEFAVARWLNPRINLIVPNVYWGLGFSYELDILVVHRPSLFCTEVEIKVEKSDIKAEQKKDYKAHRSQRIRRFFYAVPWYLQDSEYLPVDCGVISVDKNLRCNVVKPPRVNRQSKRLTPDEYMKLLELGCMRIWTLKETLMENRRRRQRASPKSPYSLR